MYMVSVSIKLSTPNIKLVLNSIGFLTLSSVTVLTVNATVYVVLLTIM